MKDLFDPILVEETKQRILELRPESARRWGSMAVAQMVETIGSEAKYSGKMVKPAYEFVLAERNRIENGGNPKLIARYQALHQYFDSRLPHWKLEVKKA